MGKLILAGILALALTPVGVAGLSGPAAFRREVAQIQTKYGDQLKRLYEGYGTECAYDLSGEEYDEFIRDIDSYNANRRRDYIRHGLNPPPDVSYCGGYA